MSSDRVFEQPSCALVYSVCDLAVGYANDASTWYTNEAKKTKVWSKWIRTIALLIAPGAAILPYIGQLSTKQNWLDSPIVPTILLTVAGALILIDKLQGFSSSWVRFITASLRIQAATEVFQVQCRTIAEQCDDQNKLESLQQTSNLAMDLVERVHEIKLSETKEWANEFKQFLSQMEAKIARAKSQVGVPQTDDATPKGGKAKPAEKPTKGK